MADVTAKLESIISGHKINEDDAAWLRGVLAAPVAQAAAPAPAPNEVWEASGKTGRMLFPTEPEARAWVAQFPASVAGGFEVYSVTVYRYPLAGQGKEASK